VRELRYYREAIFVPKPGPDSATARAIAARYADTAAPADGSGEPGEPGEPAGDASLLAGGLPRESGSDR
jgi:oligoribonuclease